MIDITPEMKELAKAAATVYVNGLKMGYKKLEDNRYNIPIIE